MITVLVDGASTQSRARRPLPRSYENVVAVKRWGVHEDWIYKQDGEYKSISLLTWVLDQGGPILGYTSNETEWGGLLLSYVNSANNRKLYGPVGIVTAPERDAAYLLASIVSDRVKIKSPLVRWFANGGDACDCSVRLARAATGRDGIISIGYHGSSITFGHSPQNGGIPKNLQQLTRMVDFGDSNWLAKEMAYLEPACVIVEIPSIEDEVAQSFMLTLEKLCRKHKSIFILDEVVTGFRFSLGGAAEYFGLRPDLVCYGKTMSNGRGVAALVGNANLMSQLTESVFHSSTYNGDPYNCLHVIATLSLLITKETEVYSYIWQIGDLLADGLRKAGFPCIGAGPRTALAIKPTERDKLTRSLIPLGILLHQPNYPTMIHTEEHVAQTIEAVMRVKGG